MNPTLVADVGNTRIKWGRCAAGRIGTSVSLPPDEEAAWNAQAKEWLLGAGQEWAIAGVHPKRRDALAAWAQGRGDRVRVLEDWREVPLRVALERPDHVGMDRLLNAVAANAYRKPGVPAVIVDAGSAVTVDWLDPEGTFRGGAIFPGARLMAQALHDYTALLPLVDIRGLVARPPGTSTRDAIAVGIQGAIAGGVQFLVEALTAASEPYQVYLTGGDAALLQLTRGPRAELCPHLTLEGILRTANVLP